MSKFSCVLVLLSLFLYAHRIKTVSSGDNKSIGKTDCEDVDRWDEIECGRCDFENGKKFCHWSLNNARSNIPWKIGSGDQVNETYAPIEDHTLGNGTGHFAWTSIGSSKSNNQEEHVAVLTSAPILDTRVCLSFWYYMDGDSFTHLSITDQIVSLNSTINATYIDAVMDSPTGGMWRYKQVNVGSRGGETFVVNIEANVADATCVIAIDDIQMKLGGCTNDRQKCDFETDLCEFQLAQPNAKSTWQRMQSSTFNRLMSMNFPDHTTGTLNGHMMVFIPRKLGDISWFTSPELDFPDYGCFQFYYYISDDNLGSLEVHHRPLFRTQYIDSKKYGYLKRNQSTLLLSGFWRKIALTLAYLDKSVYDIMATAGSDVNDGFIAIDDIKLTSGKCRDPVSCDFEHDNCGWLLDQSYSVTTFERQSPAKRSRSQCLGPATDHTHQTETGHFLYFCFHTPNQMMATIKSEDFDGTQNWCFSFWTQFTSDTNLRVDVYLRTTDGSTQIAAIKGQNSTGWNYHEYSISGNVQYEINVLSISVIPYEFIPNQGVAFDDIKLSPNKCDFKPKSKDAN